MCTLETDFSFLVITTAAFHPKISDSASCLPDSLKCLMTIQVNKSMNLIFLLNSKKVILLVLKCIFHRCSGIFACCYVERQDMSCTASASV